MQKINELFYREWNTFSDEKLQKQCLYVLHHPRKEESLIFTMQTLMQNRGLTLFSEDRIDSEFHIAMQTRYRNDMELIERVYYALYVLQS